MSETLQHAMNRLAGAIVGGVPTRDAQGAANTWAGTTNLDLVEALNRKAGNTLTGANLAAPVLSKSAVGVGTFAAGTYFWKVTAVTAAGETVGSNEVTSTLLINQSQPLTWPLIAGATAYKVYRGTVTNTENRLVATVTAGAYTDTGTAGTAQAIPVVNTAATPGYKELAGVLNQLAHTTGLEVDGAAAAITS